MRERNKARRIRTMLRQPSPAMSACPNCRCPECLDHAIERDIKNTLADSVDGLQDGEDILDYVMTDAMTVERADALNKHLRAHVALAYDDRDKMGTGTLILGWMRLEVEKRVRDRYRRMYP